MRNPYQSPTITGGMTAEPPIPREDILRLIAGTEVVTLGISDVSDVQLYGRKHRQRLTGSLAEAAQAAGCKPVVYQAVFWWCLAFIPVVPQGVYYVMPLLYDEDVDNADLNCRIIPAPWDFAQVALHYVLAFSFIALLIGAFAWSLWLH